MELLGGWQKMIKGGKFSIKAAYNLLRPQGEKVRWSRLICNNKAAPRSIYVPSVDGASGETKYYYST